MHRSVIKTIKGLTSLMIATTMCTSSIPQAAFAAQYSDKDAATAETTSQVSNEITANSDDEQIASSAETDSQAAENSETVGSNIEEDLNANDDVVAGSNVGTTIEDEQSIAEPEQIDPIVGMSAAVMDLYVNSNETAVDLKAHGGLFETAQNVKFAVWSDENYQDDMTWYNGTKLGNGQWGLTIPISNHRSFGSYTVHAYETVPNNAFIASGSFDIVAPTADVSITQTEEQVKSGKFTVLIENVSNPQVVSSIQVPVWSAVDDQDDIEWLNATKVNGNTWQVETSCAGGKRLPGAYNAHVYLTGVNGLFAGIAGITASVEAAESRITAEVSPDEMSATVTLSGPAALRSQSVQFPTWSVAGGQDDISWYEGSKKANGSWVATVSIPKHATAGEYLTHVYTSNETGMGCAGEASFEISPITGQAEITSTENGKYTVTVTIENSPSGVKQVQVPSWTDAGYQDDIVWHNSSSTSKDVWNCEVSAGEHNGEEGAYTSHVYATAENGVMSYIDTCTAKLTCWNYAYVTGPVGSGYRYLNIKNPSSDDINFAVWSDEGHHDDLFWEGSKPYESNVYRARIDCRRFKHAGNVTSHVYVGGELRGILNFWISDDDQIPPEYRQMHDRIQGTSSATNYLIAVDTSRCIVGIYSGSQGNWSLTRAHACGPGAPGSPTVKGNFTVTGKGYVFGNEKGYSCYYWTQFYGNYLFHSILYYPGTFRVKDPTMGRQVSHGCVRLELENAKWIYDNIPYGTRVVVY